VLKNLCERCHSDPAVAGEESLSGKKGLARFLVACAPHHPVRGCGSSTRHSRNRIVDLRRELALFPDAPKKEEPLLVLLSVAYRGSHPTLPGVAADLKPHYAEFGSRWPGPTEIILLDGTTCGTKCA